MQNRQKETRRSWQSEDRRDIYDLVIGIGGLFIYMYTEHIDKKLGEVHFWVKEKLLGKLPNQMREELDNI